MEHWAHKIQHEHHELSSARILLDGLEDIYKAGKKEVEAENKRLKAKCPKCGCIFSEVILSEKP